MLDTPSPAENRVQAQPERERQLSGTHFIFAIIIAIGLALAVNFSNRVSADRELQRIQTSIEREIELLQEEQQDLRERLGYVASDAYVAAWARKEGRMVRQGEVLINLRPTGEIVQTDEALASMPEMQTTLPEPTNPELWWALFFDTPPPSGR